MDDHAARLVYDGNVIVLVYYVQRDVLGPDFEYLRLGNIDRDDIAFVQRLLL